MGTRAFEPDVFSTEKYFLADLKFKFAATLISVGLLPLLCSLDQVPCTLDSCVNVRDPIVGTRGLG